jgi:hypothetical protein
MRSTRGVRSLAAHARLAFGPARRGPRWIALRHDYAIGINDPTPAERGPYPPASRSTEETYAASRGS